MTYRPRELSVTNWGLGRLRIGGGGGGERLCLGMSRQTWEWEDMLSGQIWNFIANSAFHHCESCARQPMQYRVSTHQSVGTRLVLLYTLLLPVHRSSQIRTPESGFAQILPSQIPKLFKTFSKTHSHPRTDLTGQNKTKTPIASLQGRTCIVQCVPFDSGFQEVQNYSKPMLQIPYFSRAWKYVLEIPKLFQNFQNLCEPCWIQDRRVHCPSCPSSSGCSRHVAVRA